MDNTYCVKYERYDGYKGEMVVEEMRVCEYVLETTITCLFKSGYKIDAILQWCPPV